MTDDVSVAVIETTLLALAKTAEPTTAVASGRRLLQAYVWTKMCRT